MINTMNSRERIPAVSCAGDEVETSLNSFYPHQHHNWHHSPLVSSKQNSSWGGKRAFVPDTCVLVSRKCSEKAAMRVASESRAWWFCTSGSNEWNEVLICVECFLQLWPKTREGKESWLMVVHGLLKGFLPLRLQVLHCILELAGCYLLSLCAVFNLFATVVHLNISRWGPWFLWRMAGIEFC